MGQAWPESVSATRIRSRERYHDRHSQIMKTDTKI
jgi:hypothetical protein